MAGHRHVFVVAFFSLGMGLFFSIAAYQLNVSRVAVPVALAFLAVGMLGSATAYALKSLADRLSKLEQTMSKRPGSEP